MNEIESRLLQVSSCRSSSSDRLLNIAMSWSLMQCSNFSWAISCCNLEVFADRSSKASAVSLETSLSLSHMLQSQHNTRSLLGGDNVRGQLEGRAIEARVVEAGMKSVRIKETAVEASLWLIVGRSFDAGAG